jgi:hypothetical protein
VAFGFVPLPLGLGNAATFDATVDDLTFAALGVVGPVGQDGTLSVMLAALTFRATGSVLAAQTAPATSVRILIRIDWPEGEVSRLWDGGGPMLDMDGELWTGAGAISDIDDLELAINGEAATLNLGLAGVPSEQADMIWVGYSESEVIGAVVRLMVLPCDEFDQPAGEPEVFFTGTIDNVVFDDVATADGVVSTITAEVVNRFTMRRLTHGAVLSDADQKARAAVLNPGGEPDRFCDNVSLLADRTIVWPRWN